MSALHADNVMLSPFGRVVLHRYPVLADDKLRAWDAADEYLLNHVAEKVSAAGRVLLINDAHGALGTALHTWQPVSWGDSVLAFRAAVHNRQANQIAAPPVTVASTDIPEGTFDLVLIKIPKTTALLNDQLAKLRRLIHRDTLIVGAGMVKHLQKSAFAAFESYIGPVTTSLAVKKARLIFSRVDPGLAMLPPPEVASYTDPELGFALDSLPNVFSQGRLDHGARFFLSHLHKLPAAPRVIDLGCGNGVLGLCLQKLRPGVSVTYIDESFAAVASAERNFKHWFEADTPPGTTAQFISDNGLDNQADDTADLILCNPPFHQQHAVGQQSALSMFTDSKRVLCRGGQLWIVANRHLDYAATLKRLFSACTMVGSNKKFQVLKAVKR